MSHPRHAEDKAFHGSGPTTICPEGGARAFTRPENVDPGDQTVYLGNIAEGVQQHEILSMVREFPLKNFRLMKKDGRRFCFLYVNSRGRDPRMVIPEELPHGPKQSKKPLLSAPQKSPLLLTPASQRPGAGYQDTPPELEDVTPQRHEG